MAVFAVETTAVQVVWRRLGPGPHRLAAGDAAVELAGDGGPGAAVLDGLPPATELAVTLDGATVERVRTAEPPPGAELCRIATLSDLHVGAARFGRAPRVVPEPDDGSTGPPPERCLRGALAEVAAWGADLLVVKGDVTDHGEPAEWARAGELLGAAPVRVEALPGNHDRLATSVDGRDVLAGHGVRLTADAVAAVDLPGIRVVLADTTVRGRHGGSLAARTRPVAELVAGAGPALVLLHHHLQRWRLPTHWPPGVPGPEARAFLDALARANPATVVSSGHTHRHRARRHGPVTVTEVGSPIDYPGTWGGYVVHEGGLRQTVRRIAAPAALRWTERTAAAAGGIWGRWSPGNRAERCVTVRWAAPTPR